MTGLELKVPPLPLAIAMGAVMWAIDLWLPLQSSRTFGRTVIAVVMLVVAIAIAAAAVFRFRKARTTVNPMAPETASAIVNAGVYSFTRNPMYLGFLLALIAWAVFLGNIVSVLVPVLFVAYMNRFQIAPEERALRARFGEPYAAYLRSVRRWL